MWACHHHKRHLPPTSLPLSASLPGAKQKPLPIHTPEQKFHSTHLIGSLRVPRDGLQVTAAVPLVKEILVSEGVEGSQ